MGNLLRTRAFRYGAIGAISGICLTVAGILFERYLVNRGANIYFQLTPLLLGVFAFFVGREKDIAACRLETLDKTRKQLTRQINDAVSEQSWDISFYDKHIPTCWQVKKCRHVDCPSYGEHNVRCWLVRNTFCQGEVQGNFAQKLRNCVKCEIYQVSVMGEPLVEIHENVNNLIWALRDKEDMLVNANQELKGQFEELETLQEKNKEITETDSLTNLKNYAYFQEHLKEEVIRAKRYNRPISLMMVDIDHFRKINDRFGYEKGDEVLIQFGELLSGTIRESDYAARYGGEEFVVVMPETTGLEAVDMAERLRRNLEEVAQKADLPAHLINASIGVADQPACATDGGSLISAADSALLFAKRKGRNQVAYFRDLSETDLSEGDLDLLNDRLEGVCFQTIRALAEAVDARDRYTVIDSAALVSLADTIANKMGMNREQANALTLATRLHDIGKIGVPGSILGKKDRLSPAELNIIRRHPDMGTRILQEAEQIHDLISAILYHHERWDGRGYPEGLKGDEIPLTARIVGILDAYRAMRFDRPYRKALSLQMIIAELKSAAGTQFDPELVEVFIDIIGNEASNEGNNSTNIKKVS